MKLVSKQHVLHEKCFKVSSRASTCKFIKHHKQSIKELQNGQENIYEFVVFLGKLGKMWDEYRYRHFIFTFEQTCLVFFER